MVAPVVVAGGGLAIRAGLPVLMASARTLAGRVFGSAAASTAVSAAARRTGIAGGAQKILGAMKNNKLMTALVLMELGTEGSELLSSMAESDKEVADLVSRYGVTNDPVKPDTGADLLEQADELQAIRDAANIVGGLDRLHKLRRALGLTEDHYKLYDKVRTLKAVIS